MAQTLAENPPIEALWEEVGKEYEVGTLEEFKAYLSDTTKRRKFFDEIIKPTYDVESYEQFETTYGLKKKEEEPFPESLSQTSASDSTMVAEDTSVVTDETVEEPSADSTLTQDTTVTETTSPLATEEYAKKVRRIRPTQRQVPGEKPSTVKLTTIEADGKYYAVPTIFPKEGKENSSNPDDWLELEGMDALEEARKRDELFEFATHEESDAFAKGSWKDQRELGPGEVDVSAIDEEFMDFNEENAEEYIRDKYGEHGIAVEQTGWGDNIKVTAKDKDGKTRYDKDGNEISLEVGFQKFGEDRRKAAAEELKSFITANALATPLDTDTGTLADMVKGRGKYATLNQKERDEALRMRFDKLKIEEEQKATAEAWHSVNENGAELVTKEKALLEERKKLRERIDANGGIITPELQQEVDEYEADRQQLKATRKGLEAERDTLVAQDREAREVLGEYVILKAEEGNAAFQLVNDVLLGAGDWAAGATFEVVDYGAKLVGPRAAVGEAYWDSEKESYDEYTKRYKKSYQDGIDRTVDHIMKQVKEKGEADFRWVPGKPNATEEEVRKEGKPFKGTEAELRERLKHIMAEESHMKLMQKEDESGDDLVDRWAKDWKRENIDAFKRGMREVLGFDVSPEYEKEWNEDWWGSTFSGVAKSLGPMGAMMTPNVVASMVGGTVAFGSQISTHMQEEMLNNPEFDKVSEWEKKAVVYPIAIVSAALERVGLLGMVKGTGLVSKLAKWGLSKVPNNITKRGFERFMQNAIKKKLTTGALRIVGGSLAEGETEAAQELVDMGGKSLYNLAKGKEMFQNIPDTFAGWMARAGDAGLRGIVGGFAMTTPIQIVQGFANDSFAGMSDAEFAWIASLSQDKVARDAWINKIKSDIASGKISKEVGQERLNDINRFVEIYNKELKEGLTVGNRKKVFSLLNAKRTLEAQKAGKDPATVKKLDKQIEGLNKQIESIYGEIQVSESKEEDVKVLEQEEGATIEATRNWEELSEEGKQRRLNLFEKQIDLAKSSLGKLGAGAEIKVFKNTAEYEAAVIAAGGKIGQNATVLFDKNNNAKFMYVDATKSDLSALFHEAFHPILTEAVKSNPEAFIDFHHQIDSLLRKAGMEATADRLNAYANQYKAKGGDALVGEEFLVQFAAELAANNFLEGQLTPQKKGVLRKIADLFNKLIQKITGKKETPFNEDNIHGFIKGIAKKMAKGEDLSNITTELVGKGTKEQRTKEQAKQRAEKKAKQKEEAAKKKEEAAKKKEAKKKETAEKKEAKRKEDAKKKREKVGKKKGEETKKKKEDIEKAKQKAKEDKETKEQEDKVGVQGELDFNQEMDDDLNEEEKSEVDNEAEKEGLSSVEFKMREIKEFLKRGRANYNKFRKKYSAVLKRAIRKMANRTTALVLAGVLLFNPVTIVQGKQMFETVNQMEIVLDLKAATVAAVEALESGDTERIDGVLEMAERQLVKMGVKNPTGAEIEIHKPPTVNLDSLADIQKNDDYLLSPQITFTYIINNQIPDVGGNSLISYRAQNSNKFGQFSIAVPNRGNRMNNMTTINNVFGIRHFLLDSDISMNQRYKYNPQSPDIKDAMPNDPNHYMANQALGFLKKEH